MRATDHVLHFTVKRPGMRREQFFATAITDPRLIANPVWARTLPQDLIQLGVYQSQWAEVAYFLWPTNTSAGGTAVASARRRN